MSKQHLSLFLAAAIAVPLAGTVHAASIHSAAGVVPPLPKTSSYSPSASQHTPGTNTVRLAAPSTPPPLPPAASAGGSWPAPTTVTSAAPTGQPHQTPAATSPAASTPTTRAVATKLETALGQEVTIDVVDMRFEDLLEQLKPAGWRMRMQNVAPATLNQRVDLTAQATRGDVLHELLGQANLTIKPFDGFDIPLLLITNH